MNSSTIATTTFKEDIENFTLDEEDDETDENPELSMIESNFHSLEEKILKIIANEGEGEREGEVMKGFQQAAKRESVRGRSEVDRRALATGRM